MKSLGRGFFYCLNDIERWGLGVFFFCKDQYSMINEQWSIVERKLKWTLNIERWSLSIFSCNVQYSMLKFSFYYLVWSPPGILQSRRDGINYRKLLRSDSKLRRSDISVKFIFSSNTTPLEFAIFKWMLLYNSVIPSGLITNSTFLFIILTFS